MSDNPSQAHPPDSPDAKAASALQQVVVKEALAREAEHGAAVERKSTRAQLRSALFQVTGVVFGSLFVYLLVAQPIWIVPSAVLPVPARAIDDGLRASIFIAVRHVEAFRQEEGRLPADLTESGGGRPEVVYQRVSGTSYQVTATTGDTQLTYTSSDPMEVFVGNSLQVLGDGS